MLSAVAFFSLMDAGMKLLSASYPTLQVTMLRGAASLPFDPAAAFGAQGGMPTMDEVRRLMADRA